MKEAVTIIMPIPPRCLSPNKPIYTRGGRIQKAIANKKQRNLAKKLMEENQTTSWEQANLYVTFYSKTKRRRDSINFMSMLKGAIDGIIDAKLLPDDDEKHLSPYPPKFLIDKINPRVVITLERIK